MKMMRDRNLGARLVSCIHYIVSSFSPSGTCIVWVIEGGLSVSISPSHERSDKRTRIHPCSDYTGLIPIPQLVSLIFNFSLSHILVSSLLTVHPIPLGIGSKWSE